jgi:hypothetical protein
LPGGLCSAANLIGFIVPSGQKNIQPNFFHTNYFIFQRRCWYKPIMSSIIHSPHVVGENTNNGVKTCKVCRAAFAALQTL